MKTSRSQLSGWGNYPICTSILSRPERLQDLKIESTPLIARGLGRSYGDAALNSDQSVVLMERFNCFLAFDEKSGLLKAEGGVSLEDILKFLVPRGWFLPVTPGTKFATIGGCVAADVHGKNHHVDGAFSSFVREIELLLADGTRQRCSPKQHRDLFWATVGGMGLTGIITEVTLQLIPIRTAYMKATHLTTKNLAETLAILGDRDHEDHYSVAWVDCLAGGDARCDTRCDTLGRSVVMNGHHAIPEELSSKIEPFKISSRRRFFLPFNCPSWLLNKYTVGAFNSLYYKVQERKKETFYIDYDRFFYPLDAAGHWNRLYGKKGFVQYQFVLPTEETPQGMAAILKAIRSSGRAPFLAVLKRFGAQNEGHLSFPREGYTLALDIAVTDAGLFPFLDSLDALVMAHQGKVYLAKDARMRPSTFKAMYPRFGEWSRIKAMADPKNCFTSDLSRRLEITR
jgi:decaprenylphospho-beta-D-ribofuranose 2-oxidase